MLKEVLQCCACKAFKAFRTLDYELSMDIMGRKTAIHGYTVWVDCPVRWMSTQQYIEGPVAF